MKIIVWILGIIGALFMLAGCINYLAQDWLFHVVHTVSYFHVATSCLLLAILLKICCNHHKEKSE